MINYSNLFFSFWKQQVRKNKTQLQPQRTKPRHYKTTKTSIPLVKKLKITIAGEQRSCLQ